MDVVKTADYVIDLGPEGGALGGEVVASGTPEEIVRAKRSYTGQFLKATLNVPAQSAIVTRKDVKEGSIP